MAMPLGDRARADTLFNCLAHPRFFSEGFAMGETSIEVKCPKCDSDRISWVGIENDNRQTSDDFDESIPDPAVVIHKWNCFQCGNTFRQRLE